MNERYKWIALSNTSLGVFMAALDASIVLIALPAIFRGIKLDPLQPGNVGYLLWMLMGYLVVTAVLVVTFGRLGDIFGRVRMYNAGFAVFSITSAQFNNITSKAFFPHLIASPFMTGLRIAFTASLIMCCIAAATSWARGKRYVYDDEGVRESVEETELLSDEVLAT